MKTETEKCACGREATAAKGQCWRCYKRARNGSKLLPGEERVPGGAPSIEIRIAPHTLRRLQKLAKAAGVPVSRVAARLLNDEAFRNA